MSFDAKLYWFLITEMGTSLLNLYSNMITEWNRFKLDSWAFGLVFLSFPKKVASLKLKLPLWVVIIVISGGLVSFISSVALAQAGMTVSPGKIYYRLDPGATATQKITVSNPSSKALEVVVSMNDWKYDSLGNNQTLPAGSLKTSATSWVKVLPGSYFTLEPNEKRELEIGLTVPSDTDVGVPVHTALLFLTQINPSDAQSVNGALIKVSVRMGVKIYHSFSDSEVRDVEVLNFTDIISNNNETKDNGFLELTIQNTGKIWLEGTIKWELLNTKTGKKSKLPDRDLFSLPGDTRIVRQELPSTLLQGDYIATAIINYGNKDEFKLVELEFIH